MTEMTDEEVKNFGAAEWFECLRNLISILIVNLDATDSEKREVFCRGVEEIYDECAEAQKKSERTIN
jgi:hypothetical protein